MESIIKEMIDKIIGIDIDPKIRGETTCTDLENQGIESDYIVKNGDLYLIIMKNVFKHTYTVFNPKTKDIKKVWEPVNPNLNNVMKREVNYSSQGLFGKESSKSAYLYGTVFGKINDVIIVIDMSV